MSYEIVRLLAEGGSSSVWLGKTNENSFVAIKRFNSSVVNVNAKTWRRESQLLRQLNHPRIPKYLDFYTLSVDGRTLPHLVMTFIEGISLRQEMNTRRYTVEDISEILADVLQVFIYLHSFQPPIIHRDVKPENILRDSKGVLYLIDFGLAVDDSYRTFGHTNNVGTFGYQAPEQIYGEPTFRSDLYSIGVIAVELLIRRKPKTMLEQGVFRWREACVGLPVRWQDWLGQMLAKVESERFSDAAAALAALPDRDVSLETHSEQGVSVRLPKHQPHQFLKLLRAEQKAHKKTQEQLRILQMQDKNRHQEELHRRRKEEEAIIAEQRRAHELEERLFRAHRELDRQEAALLGEMENAWDALIRSVAAEQVSLERGVEVFYKAYSERLSLSHEGEHREVESVYWDMTLWKIGRQSVNPKGYIELLLKRFDTPVPQLNVQELEQHILGLERELDELGGLAGLFWKKGLEEEVEALHDEIEDREERYEQELHQREEGIWRKMRPYLNCFGLRKTDLNRDYFPEFLIAQEREAGPVVWDEVQIAAGTFRMGSNLGPAREQPVHEVTLSKGFLMMCTPVTQELWEAVVGGNPSYFKGRNRPVEQISWFDCLRFCNALSVQLGLEPVYELSESTVLVNWGAGGYRLPTEAEWEYSAKAGCDFKYAGSNNLASVA